MKILWLLVHMFALTHSLPSGGEGGKGSGGGNGAEGEGKHEYFYNNIK